MTRTAQSLARARERKMIKHPGTPGGGNTTRAWIESQLFDHCWKYLDMKAIDFAPRPDKSIAVERGIIRGLCIALIEYRRMHDLSYKTVKSTSDRMEQIKKTEKRWMIRTRKVRKYYDECPSGRTASSGMQMEY